MAPKRQRRPTVSPPEVEGARWIPLTQGKWALVDIADYDRLSEHPWCFDASIGYAVSNRQRMHRVILGNPSGIVDHRNRNKLDNRRSNLRITDSLGNSRNRSLGKTNSSGYIGVQFYPKTNNYRALIMVDRKPIHLGMFADIQEAAKAYDEAAVKYFGEFACLNFKKEE